MANNYTEVTHQSYLSRVGNAFKGIICGLLLLAGAFILLFSNEGCSIKRYHALNEGQGSVISVPADAVDPDNEGRLIHVSGTVVTDETLTDATFGVSAQGLVLKRDVSMYQWKEDKEEEEEKNAGGSTTTTTTYSYHKIWSDRPINSDNFRYSAGHKNPTMPYGGKQYVAQQARLDGFRLPADLVRRIDNDQSLTVSLDSLPVSLKENIQLHNGGYYLGNNPINPAVGDLKITFRLVPPSDASIVARQTGDSFSAYHTDTGGDLLLLETGLHDAAAMFKSAHRSNAALTWLLRLLGFVLMWAGLALVLNPLSVLADVVPLIGNIVGIGTGLVAGVIALALSLMTIAVSWLYHRPLFSAVLIGVAVVAVVGLKFLSKRDEETAPAAPEPANPSAAN